MMVPLQRHERFLVPYAEISRRIQAFQTAMKEMGLSLAWFDHPTDRYYFTGSMQQGVLLIPMEGEPSFFVRKSLKRAEAESPLRVLPYPGRKGLLKETDALRANRGPLGLVLDVTPASTYVWLTDQLESCSMVDVSLAARSQRAVKSAWEISQIREAAAQATALFKKMGELLRPGITEIELSASIEREMRLLGHGGTICVRRAGSGMGMSHVASGDSALYPTNFDGPVGGEGLYPSASGAGWKEIAREETVMVDIVTSFNGYQADHTRTFSSSRDIPEKATTAHAFCLDVLARLEQALRPGRICSDIYEEIHSWVEQQEAPEGFMGYGENQAKFFGHGIGLELDEFPIIAKRMDISLKPGMVVAMEPKAFLKGIGPVGAENTYLVTEKGCENLCDFQQEIVQLG